MLVNEGHRVGRVNGLAVLGRTAAIRLLRCSVARRGDGDSFTGALGQVIATGGLSDLAKEASLTSAR